jgi:hypothetical protein
MDDNFVVFRLHEILKAVHLKKVERFYAGGVCSLLPDDKIM